ncbi:unnamed protein product [Echinostoma caproni]|uniref:Robl_LC7 domain-containing protein n=1 Tax=Echinostoma caproni TaxID=27848 RepID=A0A183ALU6_9TREM|nr:unnamed protein product [Echinostoma caproni]
MLRPRALASALNKMNTGGIQSVMLFNPEGVLLAFTSFAGESERMKAAIAANIWNICQRYLEAGTVLTIGVLLCRVMMMMVKRLESYLFEQVIQNQSFEESTLWFDDL